MKMITSRDLQIPQLGFGTFRMPGDESQQVVENALRLGYRHIDTAAMYDNEAAVGRAIQTSRIPRSEIFLTTKVWHDQLEPAALLQAFDSSLQKLALDYIDLYMVHWPSASMDLPAVMKTLMGLRDSGKIRGLGVCNFTLPMLRQAIDELGAPIAAVQVEYHPYLDQQRLLDYLRPKGIPLVAYAPLAQGRAAKDPVLARIGSKYGATAAQVAIAWLLSQPGVIAIPKAQQLASQQANLMALDIQLDEDDQQAIAALEKQSRFVQPPFAPDWNAI